MQQTGYLRQHAMDRLLMELPADGSTPKRFQKGTSDGDIALRRPAPDSTNPDLRSNFGSRRRQSIRDQDGPQPTPILQRSPSKRYI